MAEWITPKTDWEAGECPTENDVNRWENDLQYLKEQIDIIKQNLGIT